MRGNQLLTMKHLIVLSCIVAVVISIKVTDCGSKLGEFMQVKITGCAPETAVCILKRKTNVTIDIDFKTKVDISSMKAEVHGVVMGVPVPYPIPNEDACRSSGLTCPLKAGTAQHYTATFPVLSSYPKIKVVVKWELLTTAGDVLCLNIPTQIK